MAQHEPRLGRDFQIIIGEHITAYFQGKYINDGLFNLLSCTPIIRAAALKTLSKLSIFTLNRSKAQLSSSDAKHSLRIDLNKLSGYLYLKRLLNEIGNFVQEIYLISLCDINVPKLMEILEPLRGLTVISLPYELENCRHSNRMERFIQNNADTLVALKHLILPMSMPIGMRERLVAVNSTTLRSGTMEKEQDFYAYYALGAKLPEKMIPLPEGGGIVMQISVHRHTDPFRAAKRAFNKSNLLSKITTFKFTSTANFDAASAKALLNQLAGAQKYFPKLTKLEFELRMMDAYPNHFPFTDFLEADDDDFSLVSPLAIDTQQLANRTLAWLQDQKFLFHCLAKVRLAVDYMIGENEDAQEVLENAMNETKAYLGQRLTQMEWTKRAGSYMGKTIQQVNPEAEFQFILDYR